MDQFTNQQYNQNQNNLKNNKMSVFPASCLVAFIVFFVVLIGVSLLTGGDASMMGAGFLSVLALAVFVGLAAWVVSLIIFMSNSNNKSTRLLSLVGSAVIIFVILYIIWVVFFAKSYFSN